MKVNTFVTLFYLTIYLSVDPCVEKKRGNKKLNYIGFVDLVNKFFGMPTIHVKQVGMERPSISEFSSVFTSAMPNADLN